MAEVVQGGSIAVNTMLFGAPDHNLQTYLSQQFNSSLNHLTDMGKRLYEESRQLFERYNGDNAIRYIKAVARASSALWQTDSIRPITTIGEMQFAPPTMQRWIMAEPTVRQMYHEQRLDGYSHYYVDMEPDRVGRDHYDYRRAMNGVIVMNESDNPDEPEWSATTYMDDLYEGDQDLTITEKADIQYTWESVRAMLKYGTEDPTSRFNASLE